MLSRHYLLAPVIAALALVTSDAGAEDPGRFMFNFKIGPSFGIAGDPDLGTQFAMVLDGGVALTDDHRTMLVFSPQFQFGGDVATALILPVGIQQDIKIVDNVYLYPRFEIGYGHGFARSFFGFKLPDENAFVMLPELGIKYVAQQRFNVGFEPFSMPIGVGCDACTSISYRFFFYGGALF